jgi:hypothetical protein
MLVPVAQAASVPAAQAASVDVQEHGPAATTSPPTTAPKGLQTMTERYASWLAALKPTATLSQRQAAGLHLRLSCALLLCSAPSSTTGVVTPERLGSRRAE